MKDATEIHPLALNGKPSGKIVFIHSDDQRHEYYSVINSLTGDRLSAFDNNAPTVNQSVKLVQTIFNNIRRKAKMVISVIGDF